MPYKCAAINCRTGYDSTRSVCDRVDVTLHRFPLHNETLLKIWLQRLSRQKFVPTKNSRLCSLHFQDTDFVSTSSDSNVSRLRTKMETNWRRSKRTLKSTAIPSFFQLSSNEFTPRKSIVPEISEVPQSPKAEENWGTRIKLEVDMRQEDSVTSVTDLILKLNNSFEPSGYSREIRDGGLNLYLIDHQSPLPKLKASIIINSELEFRIFDSTRQLQVSDYQHITVNKTLNSVMVLVNLMIFLKSMTETSGYNNDLQSSVTKCITNCISSLSWNCRGTIVAGAYGRFDHEDWCTHSSSVGLWRLLRRPTEVNTETYQQITKADIVIDSSSCVLCLEFHPKEPSLLAGGNFQGDLMIWDISRIDEQTGGDPLVSNSNIPWMRSDSNEDGDLSGHKEAITRVFWLPSQIRGASRYRILTLSLDGKLFIWTLNLRKGLLSLSQGYRITANDLPQSVRVKGKRDREVALTTAAISPDDPDTLLVGSDVGVIFKCTLTSMASDFDPNLPMSSPVVQTFSPHSGSVLEIAFSTHYRNMFVSCGTHGCIHFCNLLQAAPVKTLDPGLGYLYNLSLHPTRAGLIAVTTSSGDTLIFDLNINSSSPIHTLEGDKCPSFAAKFSGKSDQLAVGDANGTVKVWTLPSSLLSGGVSGDDEFTKLFESFVQ